MLPGDMERMLQMLKNGELVRPSVSSGPGTLPAACPRQHWPELICRALRQPKRTTYLMHLMQWPMASRTGAACQQGVALGAAVHQRALTARNSSRRQRTRSSCSWRPCKPSTWSRLRRRPIRRRASARAQCPSGSHPKTSSSAWPAATPNSRRPPHRPRSTYMQSRARCVPAS